MNATRGAGRPLTCFDVLSRLRRHASSRNVEGMVRFGISGSGRLGVSMPVIRSLAREIGRNHPLATELWKSGVPEAKILVSLVADPSKLTLAQADRWVHDLDSWDICDQLCLNLLRNTSFAWKGVRRWATRPREFERRAAFALLACLAVHREDDPDARFVAMFPLIRSGARDERNGVKKAVSWSLRAIGKRNPRLAVRALREARSMRAGGSGSVRWVGSDAERELSAVVLSSMGTRGKRAHGRRSGVSH